MSKVRNGVIDWGKVRGHYRASPEFGYPNQLKIGPSVEQLPQLNTPEHAQLYKTFGVKWTQPVRNKSNHKNQWKCGCGRWHRNLLHPDISSCKGVACPLCGDVPDGRA